MKTKQTELLAVLLFWLLPFVASAAQQTNNPVSIARTNNLADGQMIVITATNGAILDLESNKAVYMGNVQATDREMVLMCEMLTIYMQTNNGTRQIQSIVAETNVVIAQKDSWAFGDRAVYTATNDLVVLSAASGEVLLDNPDSYLMCEYVVYDRKTTKSYAGGKVTMGGSIKSGTNSVPFRLPGAGPPPPSAPPRPTTSAPRSTQ